MEATYKQLNDGRWGVRAPASVVAGQAVSVRKKSGEVRTEVVSRVLWTGRDSRTGEQISLCAIAGSGSSGGARSGRSRSDNAPGGRKCPMCGARDCPRAWSPHDLCQED